MIQVKDLTKDYGPRRAIDHLNFSVNKGDVVGFLGPNGAGKSTTMKIITGFMAPSHGSASVAGFDVFENPIEVKKRIGYLPETPPVYADMYVRDYLRYVAALKQVPKDKIEKSVDMAVEKTNLGEVQKRLIQHLSKGFKQRVGIAQAIVSDPEVLILDEPTVGLDPKQVAEIRDLIKALRGQHTIILSTHILPEVQATCEKIIIINKGKIVVEDSIHHLATMEQGQNRLLVRVTKDVSDMKSVLSDIREVIAVQAGNSSKEWRIDVRGGDDIVAAVSARLVNQGMGLLEFTPSKMDLEDVFLKLTYGQSSEKHGGES
ncbi:ABC transporter ATP-binding protein [Bdellovibrio sp. SKB1291214]|uniref:ABC transporter ATP-binding protein n=1 Tax=Bdellovibrio sp. SKB1291214 TaxID=1732569 RepID=UPI000B51837B|nr:ATP-binding cassette domain-containing protein [Bdellovibrio sp. SKB1291214]UYL09779.1 ABC transporter ATP-binding protein [Bdellovibrio sp. SKB1291214]